MNRTVREIASLANIALVALLAAVIFGGSVPALADREACRGSPSFTWQEDESVPRRRRPSCRQCCRCP